MKLNEEHIINLVVDYCKGELSTDRQTELTNLLKEPESKKTILKYYKMYKNTRSMAFVNQVNEGKAWEKINSGIGKPIKLAPKAKSRKLHLWLPYAAALAIIAIVSTVLIKQHSSEIDFSKEYDFEQLAHQGDKSAIITFSDGSHVKLTKDEEKQLAEKDGTKITKDSLNNITYSSQNSTASKLLYNTISIPRGGEYSLILSDGTKVWLNADTKLRYPVKFAQNKREVYLTGEAYFEVAHNKKAPFTVHSHDAEVKVLGTSFNVSAYDDQEFIATTLVEGSVQINNLGNVKVLKPGFQSTLIRGRNEIEIKAVDTHLYTSWVNGVFEFENMELEYIMNQLGRWYDVKFFFTEERFRHIRFTGAFEKENSFEYALNLIERVADVDFAIQGRHIVVGKK